MTGVPANLAAGGGSPAPQRVLVIGCGQIGTDIARALSARFEVSVHCRRRESAVQAAAEAGVPGDRAWYGDLALPLGTLDRLDGPHGVDESAGAQAADPLIARRLRCLVAGVQPGVVVDATNIATSLADPLTGQSGSQNATSTLSPRLDLAAEVVSDRAVALHRLLRQGALHRYIRVSTTGLGSRGLELPFTHGDAGGFMSPALWYKVLFAGMEHQALWALARSFPGRVSLVIPAAFVGFERFEELAAAAVSGGRVPAATLAAGEDRSYTSEELAVLSSPFQMGAVTRADVTRVVCALVTGAQTAHDVLHAMTEASMKPSVEGYLARDHMIRWMRGRAGDALAAPVASGALGHRVSRGLIMLRLLKLNWPGPLWERLHEESWPPARPEVVLPDDLLKSADAAQVPLTGSHPACGLGETCVCADCLTAFRDVVSRRLRGWYATATAAGRLHFADLTSRTDWPEGDLLALLWHGAGAEEMPF